MSKIAFEGLISFEPHNWYWFINHRSIKHDKVDDFLSQTTVQEEKIPIHIDDVKWLTMEDIGKKVRFYLDESLNEFDGLEMYARIVTHTKQCSQLNDCKGCFLDGDTCEYLIDSPIEVKQEEPLWPEDNVTRVEIIDSSGRAYVNLDVKHLEFSYQDGGKTLKLFIK